MPTPLQYKSGSLIYCSGDDADKVYILQNGKISLVFPDMKTGEDVRNQVQPGEFFGVKSALGHFPREENAIALTNAVIMAFSVSEFELLAMSNTRIILKMLKVFSNQMRKTHAQISSLTTGQTETQNPDKKLFNLGEKYLKNRRFAFAKYVFSRYLHHYPHGEDAVQAAKNLQLAEASSTGEARKPTPEPVQAAVQKPVQISAEKTIEKAIEEVTQATAEKIASAEEPPSPPPSGEDTARGANAYYDAVNLMSHNKYSEALKAFTQIIEANTDPEWTEKSSYEAGHCYFMLGKFDACIKYYTKFLAQYPQYPDLRDAMFYIGQSYEKLGNKEKAMGWYKKIISASGETKDSARTKAMKAYKELEKG
ncbi:MAG: cyclic nucleotide-binding domain-containing protein [Treponema sp.]|jgi:CRP-like cAMP-binding protein|nr:cyclic nucleotide-binding domain-containing protein [Treponema sp.]